MGRGEKGAEGEGSVYTKGTNKGRGVEGLSMEGGREVGEGGGTVSMEGAEKWSRVEGLLV